MVSKTRIRGARRKALSGLEGLLEKWVRSWTKILGGSSSRSICGAGGRDVRILAAATLELPAPNEMRTNG